MVEERAVDEEGGVYLVGAHAGLKGVDGLCGAVDAGLSGELGGCCLCLWMLGGAECDFFAHDGQGSCSHRVPARVRRRPLSPTESLFVRTAPVVVLSGSVNHFIHTRVKLKLPFLLKLFPRVATRGEPVEHEYTCGRDIVRDGREDEAL